MSSSSDMSASNMLMTFYTSTTTPLYSASWSPKSTGGYAGTCIFLVILAIISRGLGTWRHSLEHRWHDKAIGRRYIVVSDKQRTSDQYSDKEREDGSNAVLTVRGVDENVRVIKTHARSREGKPWRLSTDLPRASVFTLQAGVGYLL